MSLKGIRKTGEKYAKRYFRLTIVSVVIAAVLTAVVGSVGNPARLSVLPAWLSVPPVVAVFIQAFGLCFALGLLLRIVGRNFGKLQALWSDWIGDPVRSRWNQLARRTQAVVVGLLTAAVAGAVAALGVVYDGQPAVLIVAAVVVGWPLGTYWLLRRRPSTEGGVRTSLAAGSRYAELRHLETRTIAVLVGFLIATAIGAGLWALGVDPLSTTGVGLLVWLVATIVVYNRYASTLDTRTELTIVETEPTDGERLELSIRNDGLETIAFQASTITDTTGDRYWLGETFDLSPGGRATITLPEAFVVSPTTAERTLPLGYTLDRSRTTPTVYTRSGIAFDLQQQSPSSASSADSWPDTAGEYATRPTGGTDPETQSEITHG